MFEVSRQDKSGKDHTKIQQKLYLSHSALSGIYIYLFTLFLVALGLDFCALAFSSWGSWTFHCGGFSCCGAQALEMLASVVVACGPWSWGSVVVLHRLRCSGAGGILPDQGLSLCPLR